MNSQKERLGYSEVNRSCGPLTKRREYVCSLCMEELEEVKINSRARENVKNNVFLPKKEMTNKLLSCIKNQQIVKILRN